MGEIYTYGRNDYASAKAKFAELALAGKPPILTYDPEFGRFEVSTK